MITKTNNEKGKKVRVAITHGDYNGISYEIIIKALSDNRVLELFTPVIYGLPKVIGYHRKYMKMSDFNYQIVGKAQNIMYQRINVVSVGDEEMKIEFGKSTQAAGVLAYKALETAVQGLKKNKVDILVTAPINKANTHSADFHFPGHTEYLTDRFGAKDSLMLMVSGNLRVATVTNHIPIREVAESLTEELLLNKLNILQESLKKDFLIDLPKIAVLGLNPHAGEQGLIGGEDENLSAVLIKAKRQGMLVFGPFPADGFFGSGAYKKFDAVLGMYHDQALIPFKLLASETGVNFTAGLPIVRTSPDHGTAYDIAGKFEASPVSMREAIYLAITIFHNREKWREMNANPLSIREEEKYIRKHSDNGLAELTG